MMNDLSNTRRFSYRNTTELPRETATLKVALLIGNQNYKNQKELKTVREDVAAIGKCLKDLDFYVICLTDLTLVAMQNAVEKFSEFLVEGAYGLFYYAGHGMYFHNEYLWPVDIPANIDYLRKDMICQDWILNKCLTKKPALLVTVLDMDRTAPKKDDNLKIYQEVPDIHNYKYSRKNLINAYSTSKFRKRFEPGPDFQGVYRSYATVLCELLSDNLTVNALFHYVARYFDDIAQGEQRLQMPKFGTTVTKPYRIIDNVSYDPELELLHTSLKKLTHLKNLINVTTERANVSFTVRLSPQLEPYLNLIRVTILGLDEMFEVQFCDTESYLNPYKLQLDGLSHKCTTTCPQPVASTVIMNVFNADELVDVVVLDLKSHIPFLCD